MMSTAEVRWEGRAFIVTGAGRGLGRAQALLLAGRGAHVVVADNGSAMDGEAASAGPAGQVVAEIRETGGSAVASTGDLSTLEGANGAVEAALGAFGRIDGFVHYASTCPDLKGPADMLDRDMELLLGVNPLAAMRMARAAWPHMAAQGFGRIVLAPSAALYGALGNTPYAAAKASLVGIVRCLALEGAECGINVNGVMPAAHTRMTEAFLPRDFGDWFFEKMAPEKVAHGVGWLMAEECRINGELFAMGGGRIARVALAEAEGVTGAGDSVEQVRAAMAEVMADESYFRPRDLSERTARISAALGEG